MEALKVDLFTKRSKNIVLSLTDLYVYKSHVKVSLHYFYKKREKKVLNEYEHNKNRLKKIKSFFFPFIDYMQSIPFLCRCDHCEDKTAVKKCKDCDLLYCDQCAELFHAKVGCGFYHLCID